MSGASPPNRACAKLLFALLSQSSASLRFFIQYSAVFVRFGVNKVRIFLELLEVIGVGYHDIHRSPDAREASIDLPGKVSGLLHTGFQNQQVIITVRTAFASAM